jgi:hypothetical protein
MYLPSQLLNCTEDSLCPSPVSPLNTNYCYVLRTLDFKSSHSVGSQSGLALKCKRKYEFLTALVTNFSAIIERSSAIDPEQPSSFFLFFFFSFSSSKLKMGQASLPEEAIKSFHVINHMITSNYGRGNTLS